MILKINLGWAFSDYFETDEAWVEENEVSDIEEAKKVIKKHGFRVYDIRVNERKNTITVDCY